MNQFVSIGTAVVATTVAAGAIYLAAQKKIELTTVKAQAKTLHTERDVLLTELRKREAELRESREERSRIETTTVERQIADGEENRFKPEDAEPEVTVSERGKKNYYFKELYDPSGRVIAREAQFRELLGLSKLSFKTSEGTRYFGLDDLHPRVLSSIGFDAEVLKRRMAEERVQMQIRGAQAQLQQQLRTQAAQEAAAREAAAAERSRAEAAFREAQAKERLASVAEGIAVTPPKPPQVNVRVVNIDRD